MASLPEDTYKPEMLNQVADEMVLIITADEVEDLEFFYPYYRFIEAGYKVDVATPDGGELKAKHDLGIKQTMKLDEVDPAQYCMLYIPGGKAPERLKKEDKALQIVKDFVASRKPIAAVCHGPQILAAADVIQGKKIAGWPEIEGEIRKAGASYVNGETVIDGQFITARWPGDLPSHMKYTLKMLQENHSKVAKPKAA